MPEIIDLPSIEPNNVTDDDLLVVYDMGAASNKARKVTRASLFKDVARTGLGTDASFATVEAQELQAPVAKLDNVSIATGLEMGATLGRILTATGDVAIPTVAAGAQGSVTIPVPGALLDDAVTVHAPPALPAGLILRAAVTVADVVTVYAFNATSNSIPGASHALRVVALRVTSG